MKLINVMGSPLFKRLVLSGLGVLMALLLLEVGLRFVLPQDLDFHDGKKIMRPSSRPGQRLEFIPNSSNNSYIGVPVKINSLGLRDNELVFPKPGRIFRIIAVGDSITFGFGVRLENTYAKRLEARMNEQLYESPVSVEVINAGIEGVGLNYYFYILREVVSHLEPDLILIGLALNDIADYHKQRHDADVRDVIISLAPRRLNHFMRTHSHLYAYIYLNLKSILYKTGVLDINSTYGGNFLTLNPPSERQTNAWESSLQRLSELVDLANHMEVPLALVVFPMEVQLSAQMRDLYRQTLGIQLDNEIVIGDPQRRLTEFAQAKGVLLIDLLPRFRKLQGQGLFLRNKSISHDWAHPSSQGHDIAADEIFRALRRVGLVPTRSR